MALFLKSKIEGWVEAGLMSRDQASAILNHENKQGRPWVLFGIAAIGVTTIATGVISLIAANWETIPSAVKLAAYFVLLSGLGLGFLKFERRPGIVRELFLDAFFLFQLAGIALIAQVFNIHSDGWSGLLFWLVIGFPAVLLAHTKPLANIWIAVTAVTFYIWMGSHRHLFPNWLAQSYVLANLPLAWAALGLWCHHLPRFPRPLYLACVSWSYLTLIVGGSILGNVLWATAQMSWRGKNLGTDMDAAQLYLVAPWGLLILACLGSLSRSIPSAPRLRFLTAGLLLATGLFVTIPLASALQLEAPMGQIIGCAGFLVVWTLTAAAAAEAGMKRLFDAATLAIAIRFVIVYFEVFGNLTRTGVGLIISGFVILGAAYLWSKYRGRLGQWAGGKR